jgi:hypothetical protein
MPRKIDRKKRSSGSLCHKHKRESFEHTTVLNLNSNQWLLPETEDYLKTNDKKQKHLPVIDTDEEQEEGL